ncbi:MAG: hypothetical protein ACHQE5_00540, partial [Actinomycetes bacterium]
EPAESTTPAAPTEPAGPAEAPGLAGPAPAQAEGTGASDAPVERVLVQASARPVRVIADRSVATVTVDGPHVVRREGGTVRVEVPVLATGDAPGSYRYERKTGFSRWISQATYLGVPLTLRVNPELAIEVEVMAGSVDVDGMRGPLTFSVTAGSLKVVDCTGPFSGTIRAGSAKLDIRPVAGSSRIRIESGSLELRLQSGSDVRLRTSTELGEVKIKNGEGTLTRVVDRDGSHELVLGEGAASMDVDVVMGSVKVRTP